MKKKLIRILLLLLGAAALILFVVLDLDREDVPRALQLISPAWLLAVVGCMVVYFVLDAYKYQIVARAYGCPQPFGDSLLNALLGAFYSAVTPLSTGGQPFQVLHLRRRGVTTAAATSLIITTFMIWNIALTVFGLAGLVFYGWRIAEIGVVYLILYVSGMIIHAGLAVLVMLSARYPEQMTRMGNWCIDRCLRLPILRKRRDRQERYMEIWAGFISEYKETMDRANHNRGSIVKAIAVSLVQCAAYMSVAYCAYRGLGLVGENYFGMMFIQTMLYLGVALVPLPGASVASEGGFYVLYDSCFGDLRAIGMLTWRLATYYLPLLIGYGAVIFDQMHRRKHNIDHESERE